MDISGNGTIINIKASNTFPTGFPITEFSDDADALDLPTVKIGDMVLGVNGDPISWNTAVPLPMTISVIPGGVDDQNLAILARANRVEQGSGSALDVITASIIYPDGTQQTFKRGKMTSAPTGRSIAGNSRIKTKVYEFMFASQDGNA